MSLLTSYRSSSDGESSAVTPFSGRSTRSDDEFRLIKWHFLASASPDDVSGKNPRVILITSARAGEGKSYIAHHLAANFALDPHIELTLIDANFDHPALGTSSWMGGGSDGPGLLDYLESNGTDQSSVIKSTGLSNVKVILSGGNRENSPELLASDRLGQLLASLAGRSNSFVIIDGGPVLAGGGAAVLARHAGHVAFVIATNTTSRSDITSGLAALDRIAGPIDEKSIGLIFN